MPTGRVQDDPQNPRMRRAYLIRPRTELSARLVSLGLAEDTEFFGQPTVVMTEELPYEDKLEGYRATILRKCKEAFVDNLFEFEPLSEHQLRAALFPNDLSLADAFDRWWTAEEVETLEIPTSW